jgi:hypothetical protein
MLIFPSYKNRFRFRVASFKFLYFFSVLAVVEILFCWPELPEIIVEPGSLMEPAEG